MIKTFFISTISILLIYSSAFASPKVIYDDDNRKDLYEVDNPQYRELARSTAAMILKHTLQANEAKGIAKLSANTLGFYMNLCPGERFREQDSAADCSGFLVGDDLLATAGHCIKSADDCGRYDFVFDYAITDTDGASPKDIPLKNIYACKEVITTTAKSQGFVDFAIVRLDRKVTDRRPLEINRTTNIVIGAPLVLIGHPGGIPTKVADEAKVESVEKFYGYFRSKIDAYGGNSGSAVINTDTGKVEGILVRGERDYVYDYKRECYISRICTGNEFTGEISTLASTFASFVPQN